MEKIEKNVPIKKAKFTRWAKLAEDMRTGDSVLVATQNDSTGLMIALKIRGKKVRRQKENDAGNVRVHVVSEVSK